MSAVSLVRADGRVELLRLAPPVAAAQHRGHHTVRSVYAAAHVVPRAHAENVPGAPASLDWAATLGFRQRIWELGLGVAEAMDTAQRNMGLDYPATKELVERTAAAARAFSSTSGTQLVDLVAAGVNTDQLPDRPASLAEVEDAYLEQLEHVESTGVRAVLMASRHLAHAATGAGDYRAVYGRLLDAAERPVVLHWLGDVFDPRLRGYFGSERVSEAMDTVVEIIAAHADKVAGIKLSLLDAKAEVRLRRRLPDGVRMYTGDDYNYVDLIRGDGHGHSDALLGAFATIAPTASRALVALAAGEDAEYERILRPTEALSRHVFAPPTPYYKTGVAFLSWLNGFQDCWAMVGGLQAARSLPHLARVVELADACGALVDPDLAAHRYGLLTDAAGVTSSPPDTTGRGSR